MRVLLADDHCMIREGLRLLLEKEPDISVVAEADDGTSAVAATMEVLPDVAILDLSMPTMTGTEAARAIREKAPQVEVVLVSMHSDRYYVLDAFKAGIRSYILKNGASNELVAAVRAAANHESYISPKISDLIISGLIGGEGRKRSDELLTPREYEAYRLLASGKSCKEIGFDLGISHKTVETYRQNVMKKLNLTNIVQLATHAREEGLLATP
ncbi:response regulator transcription factor [Geomesophilobacter sediminis]|uniref:Response regulator transcription factor n=1 Tax=Geomesophilobacter sediminis TaxID=2798584 RepID=A0A8J7JE64_9BACT|nr:response regulator transcription factor [Geomesophilobacter sediminis]MBJ6725738.1 response regulator transcription factor [Geomesophilobacter sediminis]